MTCTKHKEKWKMLPRITIITGKIIAHLSACRIRQIILTLVFLSYDLLHFRSCRSIKISQRTYLIALLNYNIAATLTDCFLCCTASTRNGCLATINHEFCIKYKFIFMVFSAGDLTSFQASSFLLFHHWIIFLSIIYNSSYMPWNPNWNWKLQKSFIKTWHTDATEQ